MELLYKKMKTTLHQHVLEQNVPMNTMKAMYLNGNMAIQELINDPSIQEDDQVLLGL